MTKRAKKISLKCTECSERDTCTALCSKAEHYVSQDYVSLRELLVGNDTIERIVYNATHTEHYDNDTPGLQQIKVPFPRGIGDCKQFSDQERVILALMMAGFSRRVIAEQLKITPHHLAVVWYKIRSRIDILDIKLT